MDATRFLASLERARLDLTVAACITPAFDGDTAPQRVQRALATVTTLIEVVHHEELDRRFPSAVARIEHVRAAG
jgi:hypothetical protein